MLETEKLYLSTMDFNHKELAAKYNMSESYIRAIINRHKKKCLKQRSYTPD